MKKFLSFMAILMAVVLTMSSCKKDEETDSEANRLKFANAMLQNKTSYAWEGPQSAHVKNEGVKKERYAVLLFKRADEKSTTGTGRILLFTNSFKTELDESSEFRWYFSNRFALVRFLGGGGFSYTFVQVGRFLIIDCQPFIFVEFTHYLVFLSVLAARQR